jgi:hypothetical protein
MKRITLITVLLLLSPAWKTLGQLKEQAAQPLTNDSVVKLVKAGLGEDTIISIVNTQSGQYSTGAEDVIALKKAGVSEKIIIAMGNYQARGKSGPATTHPRDLSAPFSPSRPNYVGSPALPDKDAHEGKSIEAVRKIYVDKFVLSGRVKKAIRKGTCLEVVDSPDRADAVLTWASEVKEYSADDVGGDVTCSSNISSANCSDGVTTTYTTCDNLGNCQSGTYHNSLKKLVLEDPHTGKELQGWSQYEGSGNSKTFASDLSAAVGCAKGN